MIGGELYTDWTDGTGWRRVRISWINHSNTKSTSGSGIVPGLLLLLFALFTSLSVLPSTTLSAQARESRADSVELEQLIADYGRGDFLTNARAILLQSVERYQSDLGRALLNFMANRKGTVGWLSPEEELLTYVLLSEGEKLSDVEWITPRLQRRAARPGSHGVINDNLYTKLLERVRRDPTNVLRKVQDGLEEVVEQRFVEVVVNNLSVKGVRKTEDVNSLVDQLVEVLARARKRGQRLLEHGDGIRPALVGHAGVADADHDVRVDVERARGVLDDLGDLAVGQRFERGHAAGLGERGRLVEDGDGGGLDRVVAGPQDGQAGGELVVGSEEGGVGAADVREPDLRGEQIGDAGVLGGDGGHGCCTGESDERGGRGGAAEGAE